MAARQISWICLIVAAVPGGENSGGGAWYSGLSGGGRNAGLECLRGDGWARRGLI